MSRQINMLFPLIILLMFALISGGSVTAYEGEVWEDFERYDGEIEYTFYSEPTGDVIACQSILRFAPSDPEYSENYDPEHCTYIASIASGEMFVKGIAYGEIAYAPLFSPSGRRALEFSPTKETGGYECTLVDTIDNSVIWRQTHIKEGRKLFAGTTPIWDEEQGILAIMMTWEELASWDIIQDLYFISLKDGEIIKRLELNLIGNEEYLIFHPLIFAGNRFFTLAYKDPFSQNRKPAGNEFGLYTYNPYNGDLERFSLPFAVSPGNREWLRMIADESGKRLFFRRSREIERDSGYVTVKDIIVLDYETGNYFVIAEGSKDESYKLGGITPDGSKLCAKRRSRFEGVTSYNLIVVDLESGKTTILENSGKHAFSSDIQISPSGRYVLEHAWNVIWIFDVETGASWKFHPRGKREIMVLYPGIPEGFNVPW